MNLLIRTTTGSMVFGVILTGVTLAWPTWTSDLGIDFWNVPDLQRQLERDQAEREDLEVRDALVLRRIAVKERIVLDLIERRITLSEAAIQFRELNEGRPEYVTILRASYPGLTDDERYCRNVLAFVQATVSHRGSRGNEIVARLEADLQAMLKQQHELQLPH